MPRYYFDISDGVDEMIDGVGVILPDCQSACDEGLTALPAIASEHGRETGRRNLVMSIRQGRGQPLFRLTLGIVATRCKPGSGENELAT